MVSGSYAEKGVLRTVRTMPYEREGQKKIPHDAEVFKAIESRLKQIQDDFRNLRTRMTDAGLPTVELLLGTFMHHLNSMEPLAKRFIGKLEEQIVERDIRAAREKKSAQIEAKQRKK